jgi:hypothetical protein
MALVGNTFYNVSSVDPGPGYPMYLWFKTDLGTLWIRNTTDTSWVLVGDGNQPYLGQLSTQGGNMNGAITGAHGLSPALSNNFTGPLQQGGHDVALKAYVDSQIQSVLGSMNSSILSALSSSTTFSLTARVAKATGLWNVNGATITVASGGGTPGVISTPVYSDGTLATEAECVWGAYLETVTGGYFGSDNFQFTLTQTSNRVYTALFDKIGSGTPFTGTVAWWIIGFRSN